MEFPTESDIVFDNPKKALAVKYYKKYFGNIRQTSKKVGIHRDTFYDWRDNDPIFAKALESIKFNEDILDATEYEIMRRVKGYNYTETHTTETEKGTFEKKIIKRVIATDGLLQFIAETKGRNRGWQKRTEITGADGKDLIPSVDFSNMTKDEIREYLRSRTKTD